MQRTRLALLAAVATAALGAEAMAQNAAPGDLDGHAIAAKLCSGCHAVDPEGATTARADVPSFRSIANNPRSTPEHLASAIILPHPAMPGVPLTRAEIRAIIDYIVTLKR